MPPFDFQNPNITQQMNMLMPQFCDKCGSKYLATDSETVSNMPGKSIMKLSCHSCGNSYMMHITSPVEGVVSAKRAEFKSEISASEINKFSRAFPIDSDEIIDLHKELKSIDKLDDLKK
jgi:hypothetical protein